jgi:hypothetical protein
MTGETQIWYMQGITRIGFEDLDSSLELGDATGWRPVEADDFNADGWPDLVWHNATSGTVEIWLMHGAARTSVVATESDLAGAEWTAVPH